MSATARDLVLGIDASTTAVKAIAFDHKGHAVAEARSAYPTNCPSPGHFEQDPEDWWDALGQACRQVAGDVGSARIAALAIGIQRETFVLVDASGHATHPAILWIDERARDQVAALTERLGRDRILNASGKPPDPTPALYGLAWLKEHRPEAIGNAETLLDVHGYLVHRLTGRRITSLPAADPLGIVDIASGVWDAGLVEAAGVRLGQLPNLVVPGVVIGGLTKAAAAKTGLDPATSVVAGAGDGQMTGLGLGVVGADDAYLSLGSGVVTGMFMSECRTDDAFRTLISPTGTGYMVETVLRSGMQLVDWMAALVGGAGPVDGSVLGALEAEARDVPPGSSGLMVVPYWAGVMNPYWDPHARGLMLGLSLDHERRHLFRSTLEGIAFEQAVATERLESAIGRRARSFIAAGGGAKSRLLVSIMAAMLERPLAISPMTEAVASGAAILAAVGAGWHADADSAVAAMVRPPETIIRPDADLTAAYGPRLDVYRDVFPTVRDLSRRLGAVQ